MLRSTRYERSPALAVEMETPLYAGLLTKAHTGFEPVSSETEVPEPLRRKLDELRAQSKKTADERR